MSPSPQVGNEIARLMRDPDALRPEWERMQRSGRRGHYDPNQPRVPIGRGADTSDGDVEHPVVQQAFLGPAIRAAKTLNALLALFAALSARNTPERRAIFEFNARQYLVDPSGELSRANVETLNRDQVRYACPGLKEVQENTDRAVRDVRRGGGWSMSSQQFGTAVHTRLKDLINGSPDSNLQAEVSRVKSEEANKDYGTQGSVRIDVLECAKDRTVCVYDIKTGRSRSSGLSRARMYELAEYAFKACPKTERVVVTEVRPSQ